MKQDVLGYYEALNANYYTDISLIKANYRELAKYWHPDINQSEEAVEKFQLISEAWNVISDESKREDYNLLSAVYEKHDYPDIDSIIPFLDGMTDIRAIKLEKVLGLGIKYKINNKLEICDYKQAIKFNFKTAVQNWLLGWWNWNAFFKNIAALQNNWKFPVSKSESLRIFIHNIVAYKKAGKLSLAVASAVRALEFADDSLKEDLQKFICEQNIKVAKPKKWNLQNLRLVQLFVPIVFFVLLLFPFGSHYVTEGEIWNLFAKKKEINYYQEVDFGNDTKGVDDIVVAKVLNFPIDKKDARYLYHLKKDTDVMHGPSEDFDLLERLNANVTVRLTGKTPDNMWYRIMIDSGEMGFVRINDLERGIGEEIPFGSKIFEE
ncbi:MAG: hypothetical protein E7019_05710 [Alphaproteobacteria bacterium]|nr:hypothetical protein [Alphaproteobacteria bacterium]